MKVIVPLFTSVLLITSVCRADVRGLSSGAEALKYLRAVLKQNHERLADVDSNFKKVFSETGKLKAKQSDESQLKKLTDERQELILRQEFLDRLVFRMDARYLGGDLQEFLIRQISDMAIVEASDPQGDSNLWKFLTNLSMSLRDQVERSEHLAYFIEGYMKFSTISKPTKSEEYVKVRSYTNGQDYYAAKGTSKEDLGEAVERRLRASRPAGTSSLKIRQD